MASPAPAPPPWVILRRVPRVFRSDVPPYNELSLALAAPPSITELGVPSFGCHREILAADPSGVVLFSATCPRNIPVLTADGRTSDLCTSFFICDVADDGIYFVPRPKEPVDHTSNVGLIVGPGDDNYRNRMIVDLMPFTDGDSATLLCFWTGNGKWVKKTAKLPLRGWPSWRSARVFSYQGKLWWVDLLLGLLTCDPFQDTPELRHIPLPWGKERLSFQGDISKYRCINLSNGKFRLVEVTCRARIPTVNMWSLHDPEASHGKWKMDYNVSFEKIWADESYKRTQLPKKGPVLALIHPDTQDVVYFFLKKHLFSVDLRTKKVKECVECEPDPQPENNNVSSHLFLAWERPPSLIISSELMDTEEPSDTQEFNTIAHCFNEACTDVLTELVCERLTMMALEHLNKKRKKEGNKFRRPECLSVCFFHEKEANSSYPNQYAHLSFYAHTYSKKLLIFAEFVKSTVDNREFFSYTLMNCKPVNFNNCHGGLYGQNVDVDASMTSRKRRRSLYCYACDNEVIHPLGGFIAGRDVIGSYSSPRQSKFVSIEETLGNIGSADDVVGAELEKEIEEGSADDVGAEFTSLEAACFTKEELIRKYRRLYKKRANIALVLYHKNNPNDHYEFTHLRLNDVYDFIERRSSYIHMNFKARDIETGSEKLFFAELSFFHDTCEDNTGYCATACTIVDNNSFGGLKDGPWMRFDAFPDKYDKEHCYACAGKVKHPIGTSYQGGHYTVDYGVQENSIE